MQQTARFETLLAVCFLSLLHAACNGNKEQQFSRSTLPVTFLIPAGFQGDLRVVYDELCSKEPRIEKGRRIFQFPANGVLLVPSPDDGTDTKGTDYFFVDASGNRKKITQMIDKDRRYILDKQGNKVFLNDGNTAVEERKESEPLIVNKGIGVEFTEELRYENNELMNEGKVSATFREYGVYGPGPVDTSSFRIQLSPGKPSLVVETVNACRKEKKA